MVDPFHNYAALEREYAVKLQTLSKKASEKKYKMETALAVGEHPTKAWDSNTLMQNTLLFAFTELLNSMTNTAQDRLNLADVLTSQVVEVLRGLERKSEETNKTEMQLFQKLLSDRDGVYAERLKVRAQDDKHAERAAKQAEQQRNEMLNRKNAYLISIAVANNSKAQFYDINLPNLEDISGMSDIDSLCIAEQLQQRLVERFAKILQHSQSLQLYHLDSLKNRLSQVDAALSRVDPAKDQDLFIDHNIRPFTAPDDWIFEPCITHYDTASKELDHLTSQFSSYKADHNLGPIDELTVTTRVHNGPILSKVRHSLCPRSADIARYFSLDELRSVIDALYRL
ncbi:hypothetical protein C0992_003926 [Termitomyces sp. T32_za158]|nr:hypothetical protein C0992_003926 [Termitomyces sp. T32_za158]